MSTLVKRSLTTLSNPRLVTAGARLLARMNDRKSNLLRVLTYHRVAPAGERPELDPGLISASPADFTLQMELLADRFHPVSLHDVLLAFRQQQELPPASVLVTFDDACADFAEHAWPILQRLNIPVTLFVPTAYPDSPNLAFWWDRVYHAVFTAETDYQLTVQDRSWRLSDGKSRSACYRELKQVIKALPHSLVQSTIDRVVLSLESTPVPNPVLSWRELRTLHANGVTLAPHTRTHPMLNRLEESEIRREVRGSLFDLHEKIGGTPQVLAYPAGGVNEMTRRVMRDEGIELAFTTQRGLNRIGRADPLMLRRINIGRRTTLPILEAQLSPQFRYFNRWLR